MKPAQALEQHREAIRRIVSEHGARNPRVFGSVLHQTDDEQSDLDILIDAGPDLSLFELARMRRELQRTLGVAVDVLTPNFLPDRFRAQVLQEAMPV